MRSICYFCGRPFDDVDPLEHIATHDEEAVAGLERHPAPASRRASDFVQVRPGGPTSEGTAPALEAPGLARSTAPLSPRPASGERLRVRPPVPGEGDPASAASGGAGIATQSVSDAPGAGTSPLIRSARPVPLRVRALLVPAT